MNYIQGTKRNQICLFDECLDNIISPQNPVRVIDAYVDNLRLEDLYFAVPKLETGKPPYNPKTLLKIYIYGYYERIRSSRRLEIECNRNQELIWLTEKLAPDFKTIADFRKNNTKGIKSVFKNFLLFCRSLNILTLETVAIDGTKLRAQNSLSNVYHRKTIDKVAEKIQKKIDEYIQFLEENDKNEANDLKIKSSEVQAVVKKLKKTEYRKDKVENIKKIFETNKDLEVYFSTDSDSRFQSDKGKVRTGYNVQSIVDAENHIIVGNDVTNESNDMHQMTPTIGIVIETKNNLGIKKSTNVIMDAGYHGESEIMTNKDSDEVEIFVPKPGDDKTKESKKSENKLPQKGFRAEDFIYNEEEDIFNCPEGKKLTKINNKPEIKSGVELNKYQCKDCTNCPKKHSCTTNKKGRTIKVSKNRKEMSVFIEKMRTEESKKIIAKRKELVEHPFGTIKRTLGYTYFSQKGLENVKAEFSFICFIYNLKRVLSLFTVQELIERLNNSKKQKDFANKAA